MIEWGEGGGYKRIISLTVNTNMASNGYFDEIVRIGREWYDEQLMKFCFPIKILVALTTLSDIITLVKLDIGWCLLSLSASFIETIINTVTITITAMNIGNSTDASTR